MGSPAHPVPVPRILNGIGWEREAAAPSSTGGGWGPRGRVSPPHLQSQKAAPAKSPERASRERDGGGPSPAGEGEGGGVCPVPCRRRPAENPGRCPSLTTRKGRKKPQDSRRSPPRCHRYRSFPTAHNKPSPPPHTLTHSLTHSLSHSHTHTHNTGENHLLTAAPDQRRHARPVGPLPRDRARHAGAAETCSSCPFDLRHN